MGKRLFWWELIGFLFVGVMGVLLHFLYEWSGGNLIAALVSGVNESTWEHMKLLFVPTVLFTVVQVFFIGRGYPNFLAVRIYTSIYHISIFRFLAKPFHYSILAGRYYSVWNPMTLYSSNNGYIVIVIFVIFVNIAIVLVYKNVAVAYKERRSYLIFQ